jgi:hypothetical protein
MTETKQIKHKGYTAEIIFDEDFNETPNDWRDDIFLVYDHKDFDVEHDEVSKDDLREFLTKEEEETLREEIHIKKDLLKEIKDPTERKDRERGIEDLESELETLEEKRIDNEYYIFPVYAYIHSGIRLSFNSFGDKWDTSLRGAMFAKKSAFESLEDAEKEANQAIDIWNEILSGEVYQIHIKETGEVFGGIIGKDNVEEQAKEIIEREVLGNK